MHRLGLGALLPDQKRAFLPEDLPAARTLEEDAGSLGRVQASNKTLQARDGVAPGTPGPEAGASTAQRPRERSLFLSPPRVLLGRAQGGQPALESDGRVGTVRGRRCPRGRKPAACPPHTGKPLSFQPWPPGPSHSHQALQQPTRGGPLPRPRIPFSGTVFQGRTVGPLSWTRPCPPFILPSPCLALLPPLPLLRSHREGKPCMLLCL